MRTTHFPSSSGGGSSAQPPVGRIPPPRMQTKPGCRPPSSTASRPPGHVTCGACWEAKPLDAGQVTCHACWEANQQPPPPTPVDRMTDTCKNITLPQTLFAGGDNEKMLCLHVITVSLNLSDFKALWVLCWKLGNRAIQSTKCVTCFWFSKDSSTAWLLGVVSDNFSYWFANCIPWTHHINQVILLIFDFCNNSFHFIN